MQEYEVYALLGFCESEWQYLGKIEAASDVKARLQALIRWPEYLPEQFALFLVDVCILTTI